MGLTLVAILTAALLLPGLVAARAFFWAARTAEVEPASPSLSSSQGLALIGTFSVVVHFLYITALMAIAPLPDATGLPLANPYAFLSVNTTALLSLDAVFALFGGLVLLCLLAAGIGRLAGAIAMRRTHKSFFYGPLASIIAEGRGDENLIVAYAVSKIEFERRLVGYQGIVVSLSRTEDGYPDKVILENVAPFYLELGEDAPKRIETSGLIDRLVLTSNDWHNIAFSVLHVELELESDDA